MSLSQPVVMFFSPYAGIWQHAMPEALVAGALQRQGAKVVYAVCDGMYSEGCYTMSAFGVTAVSDENTRQRVCHRCRTQRDLLVEQLDVDTILIDDLLDGQIMILIESIMKEVTIENLETYQYEGFAIGRYAMHEVILHHKLTSLSEITEVSLIDFRLKLKHVLMTYFVGKRLLDKVSPNRVVIYNTHPSTNYTLMNLAERNKIPTYGLHAGGNMSDRLATLYVFRQDMVLLYQDWMRRFIQSWSAQPATELGIKNATQHFLALTAGKTVWVYSEPKSEEHLDVKKYFNIRKDQNILLATLSSYDEMYSGQMMGMMGTYPLIFPTQVEWMREIISFMRKRADLFLLIRVHPRELPNRRDSIHSTHAKMLADELQNLPDNVRINWPSDGISLYDLIPQVDVGLNGWSSAGKELSMLGVPVVIYTKDILFYPHTLNILATDRKNYFECIENALHDGWSIERVKQVYRWLTVEYTLGTISIEDRFSSNEGGRSLWHRFLNRVGSHIQRHEAKNVRVPLKEECKLALVILNEATVVDLQLAGQQRLGEKEEMVMILAEIGKILSTVYPNIPNGHSKTIDSLRKAVANSEATIGS